MDAITYIPQHLLQISLEKTSFLGSSVSLCTFAALFLLCCLAAQSIFFFKQKKKYENLFTEKEKLIIKKNNVLLSQKEEISHLKEGLLAAESKAVELKEEIIGLKANEVKIALKNKKSGEKDLQQLLKKAQTDLEKFVYIASHDLKEPLRMVNGFIELLKRRYIKDLDNNANSYIEYALDGVKRMDLLLNSLLQYSRIGRYYQDVDVLDLNDISKKACTQLKEQINKNEAQIIWKNDLPSVKQSKTEMSQLFTNLIDNALKFRNGQAPQIEITCKENEKFHTVSIKDNGIGIDKNKDGSRIFDMFQRLHARTEYDGMGTGLALCKKIIECNGGDIWFESELGKGSTFYFTLPKNVKITAQNKQLILSESK